MLFSLCYLHIVMIRINFSTLGQLVHDSNLSKFKLIEIELFRFYDLFNKFCLCHLSTQNISVTTAMQYPLQPLTSTRGMVLLFVLLVTGCGVCVWTETTSLQFTELSRKLGHLL